MAKILFTTPELEHPPAGGSELRIENSIKALSAISELHLVARCGQPRMGGERAEAFYKKLCAGFLYAPSAFHAKPDNLLMQDAEALIRYADAINCDVIWFGYGNISYDLMRVIKSMRPQLKIVCDTDSVWSRFVLRELPFESSPVRRIQIEKEGRQKEHEEAEWVNFCDVTTAVSEVDAAYYRGLAADPSRIHVFSNVIAFDNYSYQPSPAGFRKPCMYLAGSFYSRESPMTRAALWVIANVLPSLIARIPDIHFYIIGNGANQQLSRFQTKYISVLGKVESVLPYLCNADVALVPLMFESGTRFKIMEAGACSVPIVSTTLGAEGIPVTDGREMLIADTPAEFVSAIERIISDSDLARSLARNCHELIAERYGLPQLSREAESILHFLNLA